MNANVPDKTLKYAWVEEERRFLLNKMPADLDHDDPFVRIIDQYIRGTRLRLRRMELPGGEVLVFKLGQKYRLPEHKVHQTMMTNIYLAEAEYRVFENLAHTTVIKARYTYHYEGLDYSLDRFEGHLAGLLLAEIESQGKIDITLLPAPVFALKDVTADPFFSGLNLSQITREEFKYWLASQGRN